MEVEKPKVEEQIEGTESSEVNENISNDSQEDSRDQAEDDENIQLDSQNIKIGVKSNGNLMRQMEIEKMVLHCGGVDDKLEKCIKLLEKISGSNKIYVIKSTRRIPAFGISPGKKSGCKITIRDKDKINDLLERFFSSFENEISGKQITENQFCFGVHEYIEVPGFEYDRDIGILGFEVMLVFKRKGKRVVIKKIKRGKLPRKQHVSKEEIVEFLIKHFGVEVV